LWSEGVEQTEEEYRNEQEEYGNAVMMSGLRNQ
jgi:hypothetical protein